MKLLTFLPAFSLSLAGLFSSIYTCQIPKNKPKVIFHYDLNRTLLADDPAGGKTVKDAILASIADAYHDRWADEVQEPIGYGDYVKEYVLPTTSENSKTKEDKAALKKARGEKVNQFLTHLQNTQHPSAADACQDYAQMTEVLNSSKSIVFKSFYESVAYLEENKFPYSIILRTFGEDLPRVTADINRTLKTEFFKTTGYFKNGTLYVNGVCFKTPQQQYEFFKNLQGNCAIQDDYQHWVAGEEQQSHGKPVPMDLSDADTVTAMADDNIVRKSKDGKNIVNPIDAKTGKSLPIEQLVDSGHLVVVNTVKAVIDPHYYVAAIKRVLRK